MTRYEVVAEDQRELHWSADRKSVKIGAIRSATSVPRVANSVKWRVQNSQGGDVSSSKDPEREICYFDVLPNERFFVRDVASRELVVTGLCAGKVELAGLDHTQNPAVPFSLPWRLVRSIEVERMNDDQRLLILLVGIPLWVAIKVWAPDP